MTYETYFNRTRARLLNFLEEFLARKRGEMSGIKTWGDDVIRRLAEFTSRGKLIRGGLVCLGQEMTGSRISGDTVRAGVAMELVQSALLIHDDIMDKDPQRRGFPSLHRQYALLAEMDRISDASHFGISMGICFGEIAIFLAFEALAGLSGPRQRTAAAQEAFASEFGLVGLAQMHDIHSGSSPRPISLQQVMDLYRFKTARYSFSLPLSLGWILGGGRPSVRERLELCGEDLGMIFQLKDDELGLFGDENVTGKSVGSDIRQGKKTPIYLHLLERATPQEQKALGAIFGRQDISRKDILAVRDLVSRYGILEDIRKTMDRYGRRVKNVVRSLPISDRHKSVLDSLLVFSLTRTK